MGPTFFILIVLNSTEVNEMGTPIISNKAYWAELRRLSEALQYWVAAGDCRGGAAAHARLIKLHESPRQAFSLWNKLLNLYCCSEQFKIADKVFGLMPHRDVVSYNTLISSLLNTHCGQRTVFGIYTCMLDEGIWPNCITLCKLLTGCSGVRDPYIVEQIHAHCVKFGLNSNGFVGSGLVNRYAWCRGLDEALCSFEEITEPDSVAWNVVIDVCARSKSKRHAAVIFDRMRCSDAGGFDSFTLTSVLKTCLQKVDLGFGMQMHACAVKAGLTSGTPMGNALVTMYCRCDEKMDASVHVFKEISEPNVISWTALISGLVQCEMTKEAVIFYKEMLMSGMLENEFMFSSILPAFSMHASLDCGRQVHARIIKSEFQYDIGVGNSLMDMYFKCGSLADAQLAFRKMKSHDGVSWTVMITGLGRHGEGRTALHTLHEMQACRYTPDHVTFLAALSACSHGGLVDEGLHLFHSMVHGYGLKPREEHYACVVDMLGRAGRLREADKFIVTMGLDSDPLAREVLLGACRMHGDVELGERSANKVMVLEPDKDGPYVLLSNIYADRRKWEEKGAVRHKLDASHLRKDAARSWSEM